MIRSTIYLNARGCQYFNVDTVDIETERVEETTKALEDGRIRTVSFGSYVYKTPKDFFDEFGTFAKAVTEGQIRIFDANSMRVFQECLEEAKQNYPEVLV